MSRQNLQYCIPVDSEVNVLGKSSCGMCSLKLYSWVEKYVYTVNFKTDNSVHDFSRMTRR